jgi:hypothetical protein
MGSEPDDQADGPRHSRLTVRRTVLHSFPSKEGFPMQTPTNKTPVSKCLDLAAYSVRLLVKFPANQALAPLAEKMQSAGQVLQRAQTNYADAVKAILPTRVDVKYENFVSDRRIRLTQQKAEMADGKKGGVIATQAFPEGSAPIVRLVGESQVNEMSLLAGRLAALAPLWPEAPAESQAISQLRDSYKTAVEGRHSAGQNAKNIRAIRDVAKESFLTAYAEITKRVGAEFPRDTVMQDLFFDDVRARSTAAQADEPEAEPPAEEEPAPAP